MRRDEVLSDGSDKSRNRVLSLFVEVIHIFETVYSSFQHNHYH